uniref:Rne/Rng family ribonuclease n=1 Tax=Virgisporangium ochraceum TaxID=65505 RepID=UPI001EF1C391|nr:Rne/Rng family ribonuclease [Virgisporangium ochraceum]
MPDVGQSDPGPPDAGAAELAHEPAEPAAEPASGQVSGLAAAPEAVLTAELAAEEESAAEEEPAAEDEPVAEREPAVEEPTAAVPPAVEVPVAVVAEPAVVVPAVAEPSVDESVAAVAAPVVVPAVDEPVPAPARRTRRRATKAVPAGAAAEVSAGAAAEPGAAIEAGAAVDAAEPAADPAAQPVAEAASEPAPRTRRRRATKATAAAAAEPTATAEQTTAEQTTAEQAAAEQATAEAGKSPEADAAGVSTETAPEPARRTRRRAATASTATATAGAAATSPAASAPSAEPADAVASGAGVQAGVPGDGVDAGTTVDGGAGQAARPAPVEVAPVAAVEEAPPRSRRRAAPAASVLFMAPEATEEEAPPVRTRRGRTTVPAVPPVTEEEPRPRAEDGAHEVTEEAGAETAGEPPARSRRRRGRRGAEAEPVVAEADADDTAADNAADTDEGADDGADAEVGDEDDDDLTAGGRRRRRGRRGRGRGRGGADDGDDVEGDAEPAADAEEAAADDDEDDDGSTTRRRRRRRRKGAAGADDGGDDPNVVVKIREPRAARDEVQGVSGSTRLEAKRQRRRDGREQRRTRPPILSEAEFLARREAVDRVMVVRQKGERTQIAVLEDDILVEHYVTRSTSQTLVGSVFLGRVQNVLPSMEAAFVDVGRGRNAVLYAGEVNWDASGLEGRTRTIEQALKSGDSVLVQVTKDPIGTKGARLTSHIALSGRHLVYVPNGNASGISRKLPDVERKRLRDILKNLVPEGAGVIVRTAAEGASEDELSRDVARLQAQWEAIQKRASSVNAPAMLDEEPDLVIRVVRDLFNEDFKDLVIQGSDAYDMVEPYLQHVSPDLVPRLRRYTGTGDVFHDMRIDEQLMKALDRKVFLPSGGSLVIDRTEAMTVIDVNTGKYTGAGGNLEETVTRNNLEAAEEIVRQLRLRDLGGIIVIDFIDMVLESNRELVLRRLTECLGRDRTKHQVTEITSLGLVQMTRKRVGQGLLEAFSETCEHCRGRGLIIHPEPVGDKRGGGGGNGHGGGGGGGRSELAKVAAASSAAGSVQAAANGSGSSGSGAGEGTGTRASRRRGRRGSGAAVAEAPEVEAPELVEAVEVSDADLEPVIEDIEDPTVEADEAAVVEDTDGDTDPDAGEGLRRRTRRGTRRRTRP